MKTVVWITTRFTGFHRWLAAPPEVDFLQDWHRHLFWVKVAVPVTHADREVEFFILKREVDAYLDQHYAGKRFEESCEMIAQRLLDRFSAAFVEVSEDGENGAIVFADKEAVK